MGLFDKMGSMMDMMGKLKETQKRVEEVKSQMEQEIQEFSSTDGQVKIKISVAGEIKDLQLEFRSSSDEFTKILKETLNRAYLSTKNQYEQKLAEIAKENMPNIPGLPI